jgi:protein-S-isoprenylcysteine O-methyltransferase Ste14
MLEEGLILLLLLGVRWLHLWMVTSAASSARFSSPRPIEGPMLGLGLAYISALVVWAASMLPFGRDVPPGGHFLEAKALLLGGLGVGFRLAGQSALASAFAWGTEPVARHLVTRGVYRYLKHPLIVGYVLEVIAISLMSGWRLGHISPILALVTFCAAWQIRREEDALRRVFGEVWVAHAEGKLL